MVTPDEPNLVVVVVEDDAETRANLCDILELDGLVVRSAGTFTECMAHKHGSPMAVILDCQLPDGTADQMIPHLKSAWPEAAIVVVTGYPDIDGAIACLRQGASDYLLKPVNPDALRSTVARIVEARRAAVTMRQRKAHLSSILNTAVDAIITIDHQGMITGTNPATESLFGYARDEMVGHNVSMLMPAPYRQEHDQYLDNYLRTGMAKIIGIGREVLGCRKDGSTFPADLAVSEFEGEQGRMFTGILRDITSRKQVERHLVQGRLDEQQRIAQELHDGVGGLMTGIGMLAKTVQISLERAGSSQAPLMAEVIGHIRDAHEQLRQVAHGLVPVEMTPQGLKEALEQLAARNASPDLQCEFVMSEPVMVNDTHFATQLYFIAQEAISNAIRHGRSSKITIGLTAVDGIGQMIIRDNGKGFQGSTDSVEGMGLRTMRYRATLIGAAMTVDSAPGRGTTITCQFRNEADHDRS